MHATAVVINEPKSISVCDLELDMPTDTDVVVDVVYSGISTGTERLIWSGKMPGFPGMGFPLVPGYEAIGRVHSTGPKSDFTPGDWVFVPGAHCFGDIKGLFGASASRLVAQQDRLCRLPAAIEGKPEGVLLALAATAVHAINGRDLPDLIIGHGVLGRLAARIAVAKGGRPVVWEVAADRVLGGTGYEVISPELDRRTDYGSILELSGSLDAINAAVGHARRQARVTLAGFYGASVSFDFPPAFMREVGFDIAAEWTHKDLEEAAALVGSGALSLADLVTHVEPVSNAPAAYEVAFDDPACLKMIIDWSKSV